jgi:hypothetical protein
MYEEETKLHVTPVQFMNGTRCLLMNYQYVSVSLVRRENKALFIYLFYLSTELIFIQQFLLYQSPRTNRQPGNGLTETPRLTVCFN